MNVKIDDVNGGRRMIGMIEQLLNSAEALKKLTTATIGDKY